MMLQAESEMELRAQRRVARKYKLLGYDVLENPGANALPHFLRDVRPDLIARSQADNVVIEVKRGGALKGSNDLVRMAETVAGHPDWRLELVVLDDPNTGVIDAKGKDFEHAKDVAERAIDTKQYEVAYVFLTSFLVATAQRIVRIEKIKPQDTTDWGLFIDLGFAGIMPDELVQKCLAAISMRNEFIHGWVATHKINQAAVRELLDLCDQVRLLA